MARWNKEERTRAALIAAHVGYNDYPAAFAHVYDRLTDETPFSHARQIALQYRHNAKRANTREELMKEDYARCNCRVTSGWATDDGLFKLLDEKLSSEERSLVADLKQMTLEEILVLPAEKKRAERRGRPSKTVKLKYGCERRVYMLIESIKEKIKEVGADVDGN